jgi:ABC-type transporter Mla subunit MlaD
MELEELFNRQEQSLMRALSLLNAQNKELTIVYSELKEVQNELAIALTDLIQSKEEIQILWENLNTASNSIDEANKLFEDYNEQMKKEISKLKRQKTKSDIIAGIAIVYAFKNSNR